LPVTLIFFLSFSSTYKTENNSFVLLRGSGNEKVTKQKYFFKEAAHSCISGSGFLSLSIGSKQLNSSCQ